MWSRLLFFLFIEKFSAFSAFTIIGKNFPGRCILFSEGKFSSSSDTFLFAKKTGKKASAIDESGIDVYAIAISSLTDEIQEKDKELEELRAEIESLERVLHLKDDQGEQFSEFYPIFSEQMKSKAAEIEELKKKLLNKSEQKEEMMKAQDSVIGKLKQRIKYYEMQPSHSSEEVDAKILEIKELKQQVADLVEETNVKEQKFSSENNLLKEEMQLQQSLSAQEVDAKNLEIKELKQQVAVLLEEMKVKEQQSISKYSALKEEMELELEMDIELELETSKQQVVKMQHLQHKLEVTQNEMEQNQKASKTFVKVAPLRSHQGVWNGDIVKY